ncbi:MAG TPA: phosphotransferase [Candidatus Limnocylindrales bacterium]
MRSTLELEPFADVLARHGLAGVPESPFPNDGWSGARLAFRDADRTRFVIKRDNLSWDWIARATLDGPVLREAWFAAHGPTLPAPLWAPYHGAGTDFETDDATPAGTAALLMPDLSRVLLPWEEPADLATTERAIGAMATLHAHRWPAAALAGGPWCPVRERLLLLSRPAAERYRAEGNPVGERFLAGWDAFDAAASPAARRLIADLARDVSPLVAALARLPDTLIHGDLKLANLGFAPDGRIAIVDWQMVSVAPIAVELGWFLVSNAPSLPIGPEAVLARYRQALDVAGGGPAIGAGEGTAEDWAMQVDLTIIVGLLLRGWRKGLDAAAQARYPSGERAIDDLAWWGARAVEAASRRL